MLRLCVARIDDLPAAELALARAWLDAAGGDRRERASTTAQAEFIAGRTLLRRLLQDATGVACDAWTVSCEAGRAPVVCGPSPVHASVSHRLGWVAAAVSGGAVGVDLECARPARTDPQERASLMLAPEERPAWDALAPAARESALLLRWTAKEAWYKAAPAQDQAWDFRGVVARPCAAARANVRAWSAGPLHVAVSGDHPGELAEADCAGLPDAGAASTFWRVAPA